ncbi:hypothetical protein GTJ91_21630 [Pseudomonas oryzihabitans]|nr:hypothetical protein [Pseudomonas oryzihabitans]
MILKAGAMLLDVGLVLAGCDGKKDSVQHSARRDHRAACAPACSRGR